MPTCAQSLTELISNPESYVLFSYMIYFFGSLQFQQTYLLCLRCQPKIIILERKHMGKISSTTDFAYSRVDNVGDCYYWTGKGIIYFPWAVDGRRRGLNYSNRDFRVSIEKHWNKSSPALEDFKNRWDECLPKDGVGIWVVDVDYLRLLPDLLFGAFVGITIEPFFSLNLILCLKSCV